MHDLCTVSDGPLAIVLSQMGRVKSERFHKRKFYYRGQAPVRTRGSQKSGQDDRGPSRKRRVHDDGFSSMDLLRGVYMLTQVRATTTFFSFLVLFLFSRQKKLKHFLQKISRSKSSLLSFLKNIKKHFKLNMSQISTSF